MKATTIVWKQNFGATQGSPGGGSGTSVPEPGAAVLVSMLAALR